MVCFQLLMSSLLGQVLGRKDRGPGLFGELFGRGLHGSVGAETTVWVIPAHEVWRTDPNGFGLHTLMRSTGLDL